MAVSAIYITPERAKVVDFGDSYYAGGLVVMVKKNNDTIKSVDDLDGKNVTVQVGTKSVGFLKTHYPKIHTVEGTLKVLPKQLTTEAYGMAVSKSEPQLTAALNKALAAIKTDGTYDKIVHKWFANDK
jgi:polar amino acid transport system substrate-binding protein